MWSQLRTNSFLLLAAQNYSQLVRAEQHSPSFLQDAVELGRNMVELPLRFESAGSDKRILALYEGEAATEEKTKQQRQGFLEKDLSDFFDIQIFSTVYFGSRHEPHKLIFDTGSSWLWVQSPYCDSCTTGAPFINRLSKTYKIDPHFEIFQINVSSENSER